MITQTLLVRVWGFVYPTLTETENTHLETIMKIWNKPQVREQAVGMEVTAYLPADIDLI